MLSVHIEHQPLILPNCNADVERIFIAMNNVKSKFRNSMKTDLLDAIFVIKFGLIRKEKCCMSNNLPDTVLKALETSQVYKSSIQTSH